jgi:predicted CopG family antitoxin
MAKTITVSDDTWQKLSNIKVSKLDKSLDITINRLIDSRSYND